MNNKTYLVNYPMSDNDAGVDNLADYFKSLLITLWDEGEGFSGKRPFGNSGWQYEVYQCLVENNIVSGSLDSDGFLDSVDRDEADDFIFRYIEDMFG